MSHDLKRIRKAQSHSSDNQTWNVVGDSDFTSFGYGSTLSGNVWRCLSDEQVVNGVVGNPVMYKGDLLIAMVDSPGDLNYENLNNGNWEVIRKNPIGAGTKKTGTDGGRLFEASIDDDYYYLCVKAGEGETIEGQGNGIAVWKKINLMNT